MISRIELMNTIKNSNDGQILFPEKKIQTKTLQLPKNDEIITTIKAAKKNALELAKEFGIVLRSADIALCELKPANINKDPRKLHDDYYSDDDTDELADEVGDDLGDYGESDHDNDFIDDSLDDGDPNDEAPDLALDSNFSKFVQIEMGGKTIDIRKSRLIWMLTEKKEKLSSDRLTRVKNREKPIEEPSEEQHSSKRQKK